MKTKAWSLHYQAYFDLFLTHALLAKLHFCKVNDFTNSIEPHPRYSRELAITEFDSIALKSQIAIFHYSCS